MSFQSWSRSHLRSGLQLAGSDHLPAASANAAQVLRTRYRERSRVHELVGEDQPALHALGAQSGGHSLSYNSMKSVVPIRLETDWTFVGPVSIVAAS